MGPIGPRRPMPRAHVTAPYIATADAPPIPPRASPVFGRALVTATAVTALGALYPALRAARLSPQEAMRRE